MSNYEVLISSEIFVLDKGTHFTLLQRLSSRFQKGYHVTHRNCLCVGNAITFFICFSDA
jgi:hypothetical protein